MALETGVFLSCSRWRSNLIPFLGKWKNPTREPRDEPKPVRRWLFSEEIEFRAAQRLTGHQLVFHIHRDVILVVKKFLIVFLGPKNPSNSV
jgi:hypothetical protein